MILGSASYLGVSLVCTNGTPVADMLAHSPPLPLVIEYVIGNEDISAEGQEGAILALMQYNRVSRVRLFMPATSLQKLIVAMDDEYPILEYLIIVRPPEDKSSICCQFPRNTSSAGSTPPLRAWLCSSDRITVTHNCCWPRRTLSCHDPPIHLLPSKYPAPMAFIYAPAGDAHSLLFIPCSQS